MNYNEIIKDFLKKHRQFFIRIKSENKIWKNEFFVKFTFGPFFYQNKSIKKNRLYKYNGIGLYLSIIK